VGSNAVGKTLAKSRLLPAMPNPRFDLNFQLDSPENVPRQAALLFEIRSSVKEVVAACRITLQDVLSGKMIHTIRNLNLGASVYIKLLTLLLQPIIRIITTTTNLSFNPTAAPTSEGDSLPQKS
jgi:hypothetical protein